MVRELDREGFVFRSRDIESTKIQESEGEKVQIWKGEWIVIRVYK